MHWIKPLLQRLLFATLYGGVGALVVLAIFFIIYLESRPDLSVWHKADLDEEFSVHSNVKTLDDYLALEDRLFAQLDEEVYARISPSERRKINRYNKGSLADPTRQTPNWNRSFILESDSPSISVLLLHGMSDSPYSLRSLGQRLNAAGALVVGLRLPGHGTAPSGLANTRWQDMAAAVRLAMDYLADHANGSPLYIIGYSNGAALGVHYALETLRQASLPRVNGLVLLSPAIGVTPVAAFAVWQGRLGQLLGLDKLAWNSIQPEYDPYKYGSFAINAGDMVYRLTSRIQEMLDDLSHRGKLAEFPPTLAFSSVVDATVDARALVDALFNRLPENGNRELVVFDINRLQWMTPILNTDPGHIVQAMLDNPRLPFKLTLISNQNHSNRKLVARTRNVGGPSPTIVDLDLSWPERVYSLSHVALPFPPNDPVYGANPTQENPEMNLGNIALWGERGMLQIPASEMLRLRWNPFYSYLEKRVMGFLFHDREHPVHP